MIAIARALPSYFADWATWWRYRPRWYARHKPQATPCYWVGVLSVATPKTVGVLVESTDGLSPPLNNQTTISVGDHDLFVERTPLQVPTTNGWEGCQ